jgi:Trk K+ transport system NAD-binding subunit
MERFIVYGSGRLVVAVVRQLRSSHPEAEIALICAKPSTGRRLKSLNIEWREEPEDLQTALENASLERSTCVLMLDEDDEKNLRAVIATREVHEHVPLVVHTFDPEFADLLEHHPGQFPIRRAYSMAGLAAPFFVAHALAKTNLVTMRFGSIEIPIVHLTVEKGSPLTVTPPELRDRSGCELVAAREGPDAEWRVACDDDPALQAGAEAVVGGPLAKVFRLAYENVRAEGLPKREWARGARRDLLHLRDYFRNAVRILIPNRPTVWLLFLLFLGVAAFSIAEGSMSPIEWGYSIVRTALGEQDFSGLGAWLKAVGTLTLVAGGIFFALVVARMTTDATTKQLVPSVRAHHLKDHVVIAGVGELGYRIATLLHEAGIEYAAISPKPDDRFAEALSGPALPGDIRLEENLRRVGVGRASCVIACSERNLANVEACIRSERIALEEGRNVRTVARIFDDDLAEKAAAAFGIDHSLAAVDKAAPAFVDAATDDTAARPFRLAEGQEMLGLRHTLSEPLSVGDLADLRDRGLRFLAFREGASLPSDGRLVLKPVRPSSELPSGPDRSAPGLCESDAVVIVGTRAEVEAFRAEVASRGLGIVHDPKPLLER